MVRPDRATRIRTPGASFIWPNTSAVLSDHAAVLHLLPQVVALAAALAHAGKDGVAAVLHGDVVDEFLNQHRFAHASAAEQADLAALGIGLQQVDDLDARFQNFHGRASARQRTGPCGG